MTSVICSIFMKNLMNMVMKGNLLVHRKRICIIVLFLLLAGSIVSQDICKTVTITQELTPDRNLQDQGIWAIELLPIGVDSLADLRIGRVRDGLPWSELGRFLSPTLEDLRMARNGNSIPIVAYQIFNGDSVLECQSEWIINFNLFDCTTCLPDGTTNGRLTWGANCSEAQDNPLGGWIVRATDQNDPENVVETITDSTGNYRLYLSSSIYDLSVVLHDTNWVACSSTTEVVIDTQDVDGIDFQFSPKENSCTNLRVDVATAVLRPCFITTYHVNFANTGTQIAEAVSVDVLLDSFFTFESATLPFEVINHNTYRFQLSDLDIGESGSFQIEVMLECDLSKVGNTHCIQAEITAADQCEDPQQFANLEVDGKCNGDSILFRIENTGNEQTLNNVQYIVIEDVTSFAFERPPLGSGEFFDLGFLANGSTYRVEVLQDINHPAATFHSKTVEGCPHSTGKVSQGFYNMFAQPDESSFISIDCQESVSSFDPNDKLAQPKGVGDEQVLFPGTPLNYTIRFQNTGTDTAFKVEIVDVLPKQLDPATLKIGSASHDYRTELAGLQLTFIFEDILLPDSNVNEPASHGYIQFEISPRSDVLLGDSITNWASIYFDFNEAVVTNSTIHVLDERKFSTTALPQDGGSQEDLIVFPNPLAGRYLYVDRVLAENAEFVLIDPLGRKISRYPVEGNRIDMGYRLPEGVYFYSIFNESQWLHTGKLVVTTKP